MKFYPHAARNARILFKLALENAELDAVKKDLFVLEESIIEHPLRWKALSNPVVPLDEKTDFLKMKFSKTTAAFMSLLLEKRKTQLVPQIGIEYAKLIKKHKKVEEVIIQTALPLGDEQLVRLGKNISRILSRKVVIAEQVDPGIIGGIIIRFKDLVIDRSFRSYLKGLRESMGR